MKYSDKASKVTIRRELNLDEHKKSEFESGVIKSKRIFLVMKKLQRHTIKNHKL